MTLSNKFIKHELSTDLCYKVLNSNGDDILVDTWNMGQTTAYPINYSFTVPINKLLDGQWLVCQNDTEILENNKSFNEALWTRLKI